MTPPTPDETLLGLLAAQPQHGYQLMERFRTRAALADVWTLSTSQLYAVLKRLENQGLIEGRPVEVVSAPVRTEYHLTTAGYARLLQWLETPLPSASIRRVRVEFLSRIYVARLLGHPTGQIIRRQKAVCSEYRLALLGERTAVEGVGLLALDLHIAQLDAVLQWIDHCSG